MKSVAKHDHMMTIVPLLVPSEVQHNRSGANVVSFFIPETVGPRVHVTLGICYCNAVGLSLPT